MRTFLITPAFHIYLSISCPAYPILFLSIAFTTIWCIIQFLVQLFIASFLPSECKLCEDRDFCLLGCLEQCLAHTRLLIKIHTVRMKLNFQFAFKSTALCSFLTSPESYSIQWKKLILKNWTLQLFIRTHGFKNNKYLQRIAIYEFHDHCMAIIINWLWNWKFPFIQCLKYSKKGEK